jgi:hypothetical protein
VRFALALFVCGNRICEVITATLGPLPLDQLPKSKPVTPYAVLLIIHSSPRAATGQQPGRCDQRDDVNTCLRTDIPASPCSGQPKRPADAPPPQTAIPGRYRVMRESPCGRWRWPKTRPQGLRPAGSGPVPMVRVSPEMRPGSHHDGWAATPQAADQPHIVRRHYVVEWLLRVTRFCNDLVRVTSSLESDATAVGELSART